jgi:hypothetical protein
MPNAGCAGVVERFAAVTRFIGRLGGGLALGTFMWNVVTTRGREITGCVLDGGAKLVTIYVAGSRRGKLAALVATWRQAIATGSTCQSRFTSPASATGSSRRW